MTPRYAWENVAHLIPKDKVIWEAFYGDGASGTYLRDLGFNTIHEDLDFFTENRGDIIVSNPPFSKSKEVLTRLKELNKPFMMILPASKVTTQYVRALFKDSTDPLQLVIPRKRIHFQKQIDGKMPEDYKSCCNFDCFYYCWKMGLPRDLLWLE
jgi:hypothetical protein